jgi:type II secretory pathway pseudopilin PulG
MLDLMYRRVASEERGFTMLAAMGAMLVVIMLSLAAFTAANGDIRQSGVNDTQKDAYTAAEAGVADYQYHLNQDPDFWRKCTTGTGSSPVNQPWDETGADPRTYRKLPNSNAEYTIEVLPVDRTKPCSTADPEGTMIDKLTGTFRIRATGRLSNQHETKRSVIATFKRTGFLDFLWFTDLEDQDPIIWTKLNSCKGTPSTPTGVMTCFNTRVSSSDDTTLGEWSADQCSKYWRDGRGSIAFPGQYYDNGWKNLPRNCTEIVYGDNENLAGPIHTNDGLDMCGSPTFGRLGHNPLDRIEVSATANPNQNPRRTHNSQGCTDNASINGTWLPGSPKLDPPATNADLKNQATYLFSGGTKITFATGSQMTVTNDLQTPKTKTYALQPNSVIYVQSSGACNGYDPFNPFVYDGSVADGCGDVSVSGTYTQNVTIGASADIVITDDLVRPDNTDYLLGLIAENFIRIAHPSEWSTQTSGSPPANKSLASAQWVDVAGNQAPLCRNIGTATRNINVIGAMLALNHQFTVDRYGCGPGLGTLNITGAIAQKWRGPVGIGNGTTGFIKNYKYDDLLKYRSPPKFLNPVNVAWNVARQVEQSPATGAGKP